MSPLARSLMALATLLTANAEYNCITVEIGKKASTSLDMPTISIDYPEASYSIDPKDNRCQPLHHVGHKIMVCNKTPNRPEAEIVAPYLPALSPVLMKCNDDANGCTASLTEYCD